MLLWEEVTETVTAHKMSVAMSYFDVLRLMFKYLLEEICLVIWFLFDDHNYSIFNMKVNKNH